MTEAAKDWSAEQWADWAAGFCGFTTDKHGLLLRESDGSVVTDVHGALCFACEAVDHGILDPLHDANHLMLVLDEIERRKRKWTLDTMCSTPEYSMTIYSDRQHNYESRNCGTRNLAVLLAAHELDEQT